VARFNLLPAQIGIPLNVITAKFSKFLYQSAIAGLFMVVTLTPIFLVLRSVCAAVCFADWGSGAFPLLGRP